MTNKQYTKTWVMTVFILSMFCIGFLMGLHSATVPAQEVEKSAELPLPKVLLAEIWTNDIPAPEDVYKPPRQYRALDMEATAYTAGPESTGKSPGHPAYGITKSGTTVKEARTIAVDPTAIPLGTKVIVFYDGVPICECVAEDTGRLIKGNIIDLYIEDLGRALHWGRRQVVVWVPL